MLSVLETQEETMTKKKTAPAASKKPKTETRPMVSMRLDAALAELARRRCYWTPGLTMSGLVEEALRRELARLERSLGPIPDRPRSELKRGRPAGG
jgi:post-segregation antitoxin (ccd killing protein)